MRDWLETQEEAPQLAVLAYAAGLDIDPGDAAPGAIRRALLLLATGGDPLRGVEELDGRAVTALAADLDDPSLRAQLADGLAALRATATGLPNVVAALDRLAADPDLAWRAYASGLLADSLDE
jgi:hypothetical protein